ncbi:MAG: HIT family protein [Bacteroidota bacterium]|nr:HIT family protein [Bacteroidota bacterium]
MNCPFCLLNSNEHAFASSRNFLAVYDISPMLPGHSLIIPREHIESLHELDQEKLAEFFLFARKVTKGLCEMLDTDAFDWSIQEKEEAGQSVSHLHMHIIPRTKNDLPNPGDWYPLLMKNKKQTMIDSANRPRFTDTEFLAMTQRLRKKFHP